MELHDCNMAPGTKWQMWQPRGVPYITISLFHVIVTQINITQDQIQQSDDWISLFSHLDLTYRKWRWSDTYKLFMHTIQRQGFIHITYSSFGLFYLFFWPFYEVSIDTEWLDFCIWPIYIAGEKAFLCKKVKKHGFVPSYVDPTVGFTFFQYK